MLSWIMGVNSIICSLNQLSKHREKSSTKQDTFGISIEKNNSIGDNMQGVFYREGSLTYFYGTLQGTIYVFYGNILRYANDLVILGHGKFKNVIRMQKALNIMTRLTENDGQNIRPSY